MQEGEPIEANMISRAIETAQKRVEAHNFDIRKHLLEYDDVMNKHREIIYSLRKKILNDDGSEEIIQDMIEEKITASVMTFTDPKSYPEDWDIDGLNENLTRLFGFRPRIGPKDLGKDEFESLTTEDLTELIVKQVQEAYDKRGGEIRREDLNSYEKLIMLQIIDNQWVIHLQDMEHMKEGIGLRGYGQLDPLREYQKEGFALFEELMNRIREEILMTLSRIQFLVRRPEALPDKKKKRMQFSHGDEGGTPVTVKREGKKIGRNAPCPCGSGKKYKKCCGANV
jgi:preprotein translocase subunit SecA